MCQPRFQQSFRIHRVGKSGQLEGFDADATRYSIEPTRFAIMFALMMEHGSVTWNRLKV